MHWSEGRIRVQSQGPRARLKCKPTCPTELTTLSKAAPTGASTEALANHLCLSAAEAVSRLLGWYSMRLVSRSQALPPSMFSISKASWLSLVALRCAAPRHAVRSHFRDSSFRLKAMRLLSLQESAAQMSSTRTVQLLTQAHLQHAQKIPRHPDDAHYHKADMILVSNLNQ